MISYVAEFGAWSLFLIYVDLEDLKQFAETEGAPEANDLSNWDISFWSERLQESKYEINEVGSLSLSH